MNIEQIEKLIKILKESDISEIVVEEGNGVKIHLKRDFLNGQTVVRTVESAAASSALTVVPPSPAPVQEKPKNHICAKMPGTFYRSPSPQSPPYVQEGDIVNENTVICIIEAMKIFNEIKAGVKGRIVKVLVENGEGIEYNQPLFEIENT